MHIYLTTPHCNLLWPHRTILEMGLREAYPGRVVAVFAYEALKDTHTERPAALGSNRGWRVR